MNEHLAYFLAGLLAGLLALPFYLAGGMAYFWLSDRVARWR